MSDDRSSQPDDKPKPSDRTARPHRSQATIDADRRAPPAAFAKIRTCVENYTSFHVWFIVVWGFLFGSLLCYRHTGSEVVADLQATTEKIMVRVDSEQLGRLRLRCSTLLQGSSKGTRRIDDNTILELRRGSEWTAVALGQGEIYMRITPPPNGHGDAFLEKMASDGPMIETLALPATIKIDSSGCPGRQSRLAIHGMIELGEEMKGVQAHRGVVLSNAPYLLLSGHVTMRMLMSVSSTNIFVEFDQFELQPGARFIGGDSASADPGSRNVSWSGFVEPTADGALAVRVSSSGRDFRVLSETGGDIEGASIRIGLLALILNDPLLLGLASLFTAFEIFYMAVEGAMRRKQERMSSDPKKDSPAAEPNGS